MRQNLHRAQKGDYLVTLISKTLTLFHIYDKDDQTITIEEICLPKNRQPKNWKQWVERNAPGHTQWTIYEINLHTGRRLSSYSFTKNYWFEISENDDILSKILNLKLYKIPEHSRKFIGLRPQFGPDNRQLWQPSLIVEGKNIKGVLFDAWHTTWPKDHTNLSEKKIIIYTPQDNQQYPSYFPYWLEFNGVGPAGIGQAKIRIVDSGSHLISPKPPISSLKLREL
ncbi:MAG: hypothetical protein Q8K60_09775 [Parachlamydiaceae bacterium]|nr:hypothetical protein [Parachlamydiaceae bacterium]